MEPSPCFFSTSLVVAISFWYKFFESVNIAHNEGNLCDEDQSHWK